MEKSSVGFKTVQFYKDQTLGIGSYGKVCKAKCDDLLCAAKLIHETLFDPTAQQLIAPQREHRLPMRRFQQECEFLSTIRHPNIIQYLGIYQDPDTGLPALLMELMDDNLTHFLESSTQPIPYHIQVNICHDITLALSFLHSNDIVHRDLSSNNVLLIGKIRAKVTDFGMARLGDQNPRATHLTFTMCPGTDVFMPPEAVQDEPVYTEKIDCFSFGVITLQILTRQFPKPGNRRKRIEISHPGLPSGTMAEVPIPEIERRQNHIGEIDPNHSLLQVVLDCLKDRDVERPSSHQLCEAVTALKESPKFSKSMRAAQEITWTPMRLLEEKSQRATQGDQTVQDWACTTEMTQQNEQKIEQNVEIEEVDSVIKQLVDTVHLEDEKESTAKVEELEASLTIEGQQSNDADISITWRKVAKVPDEVISETPPYAAVGSGVLYIITTESKCYAYTLSTSSWSQLPQSPTAYCPSVVINNLFTLIGGSDSESKIITNQLFSLTGLASNRKWTKKFPSMPTKRKAAIALNTGKTLIVAGGSAKDERTKKFVELTAIELMDVDTHQWSIAADLFQSLSRAPVALCGTYLYLLGKGKKPPMYVCPVRALVQSGRRPSMTRLVPLKRKNKMWNIIAGPPVVDPAFVSVHDHLLSIGGRSDGKSTEAVHLYHPASNKWEFIGHMATPRYNCIAAVLPNSELMVIGGRIDASQYAKCAEFGTIGQH